MKVKLLSTVIFALCLMVLVACVGRPYSSTAQPPLPPTQTDASAPRATNPSLPSTSTNPPRPTLISSTATQVVLHTETPQVTSTPSMSPAPTSTFNTQPRIVALPNGSAGIGFDDLLYSPELGKLIAPGGRTGNLDLVDPRTLEVTAIAGFSASDQFGGGHGEGTTSADSGQGFLFAIDRTSRKLEVVDPKAGTIVASATLAGNPDYIRYVAATHELWVTEPDNERIEVFSIPTGNIPTPAHAAFIPVPGGPESLVIDGLRGRAYTHLWNGATVAIDIAGWSSLARWPNGCSGSRGIALDEKRGFLFAGCSEGKAVVLDVEHDGRQLSSLNSGSGVDVISYSAGLGHLYVPGSTSASLAILGVSSAGELSLLANAKTAIGAHCVAADDKGQAWVCDPSHGQLLLIQDTFPASGH